MTNSAHLTTYLDEYIKMKNPQFAVLITGKWGCGKTYYIKKRIEEWSTPIEAEDDKSIILKPIYISVNGLNSINSIAHKIKAVIHPILYSKGMKAMKKITLTALQIVAKSKLDLDSDGTGEDLNSLLDTEGIINLFKSDSTAIRGNRILVIDDIERCKIPLDELFGFLNGIVEHSDSKVILLCDENKLKDVVNLENLSVEYDNFKEKLIGQTFALEVDYAALISEFIDNENDTILSSQKNLIIELFIASKCENLRLVKRCLIDIKRFFQQLPEGIESNQNYDFFISNVVAYLVIVSLEVRYGNQAIEHYQSYHWSDEAKKASNVLESKYNSILESYHLYNSAYSIPINYLVEFIETGFLVYLERIPIECRILNSHNLKDWEKLWNCYGLSNDEFTKILDSEKKRFIGKELEYVFEVVHLAGIFLSFEERNLVKFSRRKIVVAAKSNIKRIFDLYPDDTVRTCLSNQGYEFICHDTSEMKEIISYSQSLFNKRVSVLEANYVAAVWSKLGSETTRRSLNDLFNKATPTRRCTYCMESIFTQFPYKKLANKIAHLPNSTKIEIINFFIERYYLTGSGINGTINNKMKADKDNLFKISSILKSKAKQMKLIDKATTLNLIARIDEAINKM